MNHGQGILRLALGAFVFAQLSGCALIKASPRQTTTGFLEHGSELRTMPERYPFNRVWVTEQLAGKDRKHYSKLYIAPVDLTHLDNETWKIRARDVGAHPEDVQEISEYLRGEFAHEMKDFPGTVVQVIDEDDKSPDTVRLELSIVELVPTATLQKGAATIAGLLIPGGGLLGATSSGSIAIEGRVVDANTGNVLGEFADRELDKSAPIDFASFKWYSRSKENIDDWAQQFAKLANTTPDEKVAASLPFTLNPF
jgi:hypothetical protein